ncbi:MAG: hypothetical protein HUU20_02530 [Pirellulales bacterium]|nr:hypothetical protein [Pirellulales bacterium]
MKSERRHELQHNELAAWITRSFETVRPYGNAVVGAIAVVCLVAIGWIWWSRQSAADDASAWNNVYQAQVGNNPAALMEVAESHPDANVGQWAAAVAGDMFLVSGCEQLFTNKATAAQELRKAVESYLVVLKNSQSPTLRERATFGLARAYESLSGTRQSQGELDRAIESYQTLLDKWPDGAYTELARQRLTDLQRPATKQFYDKFAQYDPKPAYTEQPGTPGEKLPFSTEALPDFSELPKPDSATPEPATQESTPKSTPVKTQESDPVKTSESSSVQGEAGAKDGPEKKE